jgi:surface protein
MTKTAMAASSDHFVSTWKTGNSGVSNSTSITVPMVGGLYDIDWDNDGNFDQFGQTNMSSHDYGVAGVKTIRIRGSYDSIYFHYISDRQKILSIDQWGTNSWKTMENAFDGTLNLQIVATDTPDFSAVTSMTGMFNGAKKANPDTSAWDTSAVTTMFAMFSGATSANPDTSSWDTSAVTDMSWMFSSTSAANPDTSAWDTSAVTNMYAMFQNATVANPDTSLWNTSAVTNMSAMFNFADLANPDTGSWDTAAVTDMSYMFNEAVSADPDTSDWDTSSVTDMSYMFKGTTSANPDTSNWNTAVVTTMAAMFWGSSANPDTSLWETTTVTNMFRMFSDATSANPDVTDWNTENVTSMYRMFDNALSFDKDIGSWSVSSLSIASGMLNGVKLSTVNYDNLLIGWEAQPLIEGVSFSAGDSSYCTKAAIAARTSMITAGSWNITDGGQECPPPSIFNIAPIEGLTTTEAGDTATFNVSLTSEPTDDVSINLSSSRVSEGTVTPISLTFTSLDWATPQTVTITGVDDSFDDGDQVYSVITSSATSSDADYHGFNPIDVSVTNLDNETPQNLALIVLYNSTNGPNWTTNTNWLKGDPCANAWYGVTCDANIRKIKLDGNNLVGAIPAEIGDLTHLELLDLSNNQLSGSIPTTLGSITKLNGLYLNGNKLSGAIPLSLTALSHLRTQALPGYDSGLNIHWNALSTNDAELDGFLNAESESNWSETQTIAPKSVVPSGAGSDSVTINWDPIEFTVETGRYRVLYGTAPGGPYSNYKTTINKTTTNLTVSGLTSGVYYFVVQTETDSHDGNMNAIVSNSSDEVSVEVNGAPGVEINSFDATPTVLEAGESTVFSWTSDNATECFAVDGTDGWRAETIDIPGGNVALTLNTPGTHTFTLECTDGINIVSASRQVVVMEDGSSVKINSFGISPSAIDIGQPTSISWDIDNAVNCTILKDGISWPEVLISTSTGRMKRAIEEAGCHTITLECSDGYNTVSVDQNVDVIDPGVIFSSTFDESSICVE